MSGLTSPTYTFVADTAPTPYGKQVAITTLNGTQTGVVAHTIQSPFTLNFVRPTSFVPALATGTSVLRTVQKNNWRLIARKGVLPSAGGTTPEIAMVDMTISIPSGAETADVKSCQALLSLVIGALSQVSSGLGDTVTTGIV